MDRLSIAIEPSPPRAEVLESPRASRISAEAEKLAARIERAVRRGTNDKVRDLRVDVLAEGIVLRGRCGTYYSKQLAQHSALTIAQGEGLALINRIEVW